MSGLWGRGDALYIFIFNNSINEYPFSEAIRSPLLAMTLHTRSHAERGNQDEAIIISK
jgi:hypothetical protein